MSNKKIEIELKLPLLNGDEVVSFLQKNATFLYETRQIDEYYNAPHRDFLADPELNEWFRVRVTDTGAAITYKDLQPHGTRHKTHCKEYETNVDSYDHLSEILKVLNFSRIIDVKKHRRVWRFQDADISIDAVEDLGDFIEVEYTGDLEDVNDARTHLFCVLKSVGAKTDGLAEGYPYLLLRKRGFLKE